MVKAADLADFTDAELEAEQQRLMEERAIAERPFKEALTRLQREMDRRASSKRAEGLASALADLTPEDRAALRAMLED